MSLHSCKQDSFARRHRAVIPAAEKAGGSRILFLSLSLSHTHTHEQDSFGRRPRKQHLKILAHPLWRELPSPLYPIAAPTSFLYRLANN